MHFILKYSDINLQIDRHGVIPLLGHTSNLKTGSCGVLLGVQHSIPLAHTCAGSTVVSIM